MNTTPSDTPVRVRLTGLAELAPPDQSPEDLRAWLTAPIAGEPLYKRALEVLLPLAILELVLEPGPASETVLTLFEERPIYNLKARMAQNVRAVSNEHAATLVVPLGGMLEADLAGLVARGHRNCKVERTHVSSPGPEVNQGTEIVYLPPGHGADEYDPSTPPTDTYSPSPPILLRTGGSVKMRELAQRALEGDLACSITGKWRGDLLMGEGAEVDPSVRMIGKAAVGRGSVVEEGVILGHGAVVGEGCHIGTRSQLTHAMVLDRATVTAGEHILGLVRMPGGGEI